MIACVKPTSAAIARNDQGEKMRHARKAIATAAIAASLAGGAAGFAFTSNSAIAGAEEATTTSIVRPSGQMGGAPRRAPGAELSEVLKPLVDDSTINQSQADAVIAAIQAARPAGGEHENGAMKGPKGAHAGKNLEVAADAIGVTVDDLKQGIKSGTTVAAQAQAKGVEPQTVIDALVNEMTTHITSDVADGKLTQTEADERIANATERISKFVNELPPTRP